MTSIIDAVVTIWVLCIPIFVLVAFCMGRRKGIITAVLLGAVSGFFLLIQPDLGIPVREATKSDWNPKSFWHEPWGASVVHRGIDIFAKAGTDVVSPTGLYVIYTGENPVSGKFILAIDRSFRVHFFAHLQSIKVKPFALANKGVTIGAVGDTGNARGKPPHLHYGLASMIPQPWLMTGETRGHLRAFYLNPEDYFRF